MFDHITGSACGNCESAPAGAYGPFCSRGCRDEYEGTGAYAERDCQPVTRTGDASVMDLFGGELLGPQSHQVDIFEAIAEAELGNAPAAPRYGDELGIIDLFGAGQLVLEVA